MGNERDQKKLAAMPWRFNRIDNNISEIVSEDRSIIVGHICNDCIPLLEALMNDRVIAADYDKALCEITYNFVDEPRSAKQAQLVLDKHGQGNVQ